MAEDHGSSAQEADTHREADAAVLALIARLERGERSNKLDVLVECALFQPDETTFDAVPNSAGTKVIYANRDGSFSTHWARDYSLSPAMTITMLKATTASAAGTSAASAPSPQPQSAGE